MAYSDYGGYAYRNGVRVEERSDCTITPEGDTFGTPGMWPGFAMLMAGMERDEVLKRTEWPHGHAVLGDGPLYVVLYKQSTVQIYRGFEQLDPMDFVVGDAPIKEYEYDGQRRRYVDHYAACDIETPVVFEVDGVRIVVHWIEEDNYYQYVRVEQPDGVVWCGWSGYGVGAGFEGGSREYSSRERDASLLGYWPDAIA